MNAPVTFIAKAAPTLLTPQQLHEYQKECVLHQLYYPDSMLWLQMGLGKLLPNSEPVLTPNGWIANGDIRLGSQVIGSDGKPTTVTGLFPQGEKEVVTVTFSDGSWCRCGWEHLWSVTTDNRKFSGLPNRVMTTREIVDAGLTNKNGKNKPLFKWSIPITQPVEYTEKQLAIDPYTLGVILGDAWISPKGAARLTTDIEILQSIDATMSSILDCGYVANGFVRMVSAKIKGLGLAGKRSWEKFVPEIYMRGSVEQRLALLQGLLDTDGSPIDKGGVEFSSTAEALADAVVELTQSLGGVAQKSGPRITQHQNGDGRPSWRVNVKLPGHLTPFRLTRKLDKWFRPTKYQPVRKIVSIKVTGREESTCIMVDAPDHLYLTRHHIVTHNTAITLTTIVDRMRAGQVKKVLIFGPLRVIQAVWEREARKWTHTKHLRFSVLHGAREKRARALFADADIFLCNYEAMNWLAQELDHYFLSQGHALPMQMVVYDEVSKLKNSTTKRMAGGKRDKKDKRGDSYVQKLTGWRKMIDEFQFRIGLTGTPASNGYIDLHGQYLAVDGGERLGEYVTHYRDSYFANRDGHGWKYEPTEIGRQWIEHKISDITKKMDAKDYLDMPAVKVVNMMVTMPERVRAAYRELEKTLFTQLDSGTELELFNKASLSNKCLQFCNGTAYHTGALKLMNGGSYEKLHDEKLDALEEVLDEAGGQPVLCSYSFVSDAERIMERFKAYKPVNLTASKSAATGKIIDNWNAGKIKLMIGHPASMGHGIDGLQQAGHILVWFGMPWSLELYNQMNARLDRQGQPSTVSIIRILCNDSVDLAVADAIERKQDDENGLKAAIDRYRKGYTTNDLEMNFY